ncbi:MAG: hypothetical protein UIM24_05395 [Clostridia bacterium]|nr:hypothetical protein [Clostridia bacterium]
MTITTVTKGGVKSGVTYAGLKLNNKTDADILSAIGGVDTRQEELKRLIRIGIEEDKANGTL